MLVGIAAKLPDIGYFIWGYETVLLCGWLKTMNYFYGWNWRSKQTTWDSGRGRVICGRKIKTCFWNMDNNGMVECRNAWAGVNGLTTQEHVIPPFWNNRSWRSANIYDWGLFFSVFFLLAWIAYYHCLGSCLRCKKKKVDEPKNTCSNLVSQWCTKNKFGCDLFWWW